jgi:hypothetical protein
MRTRMTTEHFGQIGALCEARERGGRSGASRPSGSGGVMRSLWGALWSNRLTCASARRLITYP